MILIIMGLTIVWEGYMIEYIKLTYIYTYNNNAQPNTTVPRDWPC